VKELALRALDSKRYNEEAPGSPLPWRNVIIGAFAGHYYPTGTDDGYNSDFEYQRLFDAYMAQLEAECPGIGTPGADTSWPGPGTPVGQENWLSAVGTSIDGLAYLWGGADAVIVQEFGPTDFSINVHPDWYAYALAYGFEQPGHPGIDIALPAGTPLYAPAEAFVVCAGTDNPAPKQAPDSCGAFTDESGAPTSGRLQVRLPNGDMLIYGQVRASVVEPGATVSAGQLIGYSGGFNGDHLHLEYRTIDPTTPSGWRVIDPRLTPLNGLVVPVLPNDATPCPATPVTSPAASPGTELVLEISEVTMWDVAATPEPAVPGNVKIDESGTETHITTDDGSEADVSISPEPEVPFTTVTEYQVGCAEADE
jgi:murein DD-endopeptidase MepM/ murein hydrolase activator NlpD